MVILQTTGKNLLHKLHKKFIYPIDPAGFVLRYSVKVVIAVVLCGMLGALLLPSAVHICVLGSFFLMQIRVGRTLSDRLRATIHTSLICSVVAPVGSLLGGSPIIGGLYVALVTFATFFASSLGTFWGMPSLMVLVLTVVNMGFPVALPQEALVRMFSVFLAGACCCVVNLKVWPYDPVHILQRQLAVAFTDLGDYLEIVGNAYTPRGWDPTAADAGNERSRNAIATYRGTMETLTMGSSPDKPESDKQSFFLSLMGIYEATASVAQHALRGTGLGHGAQSRLAGLCSQICEMLWEYGNILSGSKAFSDATVGDRELVLFSELDELEEEIILQLHDNNFEIGGSELMAAMSTVYMMKTLVRETLGVVPLVERQHVSVVQQEQDNG